MKKSMMNYEFYGQSIEKQIPQKFENHGCILEPSLWFVAESWLWILETTLIAPIIMVMNPRNHPDSSQGSIPISNNHPTPLLP
jgi:hypothetical protein